MGSRYHPPPLLLLLGCCRTFNWSGSGCRDGVESPAELCPGALYRKTVEPLLGWLPKKEAEPHCCKERLLQRSIRRLEIHPLGKSLVGH